MALVSVVIPTYNRASTLPRAMKSVLRQGMTDFEMIIVDDGSTDNTYQLVASFSADVRVRYYKVKNGGVSLARNFGAYVATGKYLLFLDSDDELNANYFDEVENSLGLAFDAIFVSANLYKGDQLIVVKSKYPHGNYSEDGLYLAGCFLIRKEIFDAAGGYDPEMTYGENTELSIRLIPVLNNRKFIEQPLINIFQDKISRTSNSLKNVISSTEYILAKHKNYYEDNRYPKWLYHNILAVSYVRLNNPKLGRRHLLMALRTSPFRIKTYIRLFVICLPFLRKRVYGG